MSQRTIVRCDRRTCCKEVENPPGAIPYSMNIRGVNYDLCPSCERSHRAFMLGANLPAEWSTLTGDEQENYLRRWASEVQRP